MLNLSVILLLLELREKQLEEETNVSSQPEDMVPMPLEILLNTVQIRWGVRC